jgi:predicted nuclease with TOPRIM domain
MGKALRILVFIILILSVISLVFANLLFKKRELLTKRNEILENTVVNIAKTIEGEDAPDSTPPSVEKDISDVTDRELVNPEKLAMLENYPISLEQQNLPALDLDNNKMRLQLRSYYVVGPDGEYKIDELTQKPATKGDGSMVAVLENVFDRAKTQQAKLNKTRAELTKLREMLSTTVDDVNALKVAGRTDKKSLTEKGEMITTLQGEKETLEANVAKLTAEKRELNAELADSRNAVETLNEDKLALEEKLTEAKEKNADWEKRWKGLKNTPSGDPDVVVVTSMTAGEKGKIIEVNDELKFAILEFSNEAIEEILGTERQNPLPQLEMNVRRPGHQSASGEFITRIKLRQVVRDKNLIVADILSDWQQTAVEKGDVVFF